jgi:large subunit ribosomal protein L29
MKKVKASKIRELGAEEAAKKVADLREELFKLRFQHATGQLENPVRMRTLRRELARVLTVRSEQAAAAAAAKAAGKAG